LASEIFTDPVNGIYHFEFSGLKAETATDVCTVLQVNSVTIGSAGTNTGTKTGTIES